MRDYDRHIVRTISDCRKLRFHPVTLKMVCSNRYTVRVPPHDCVVVLVIPILEVCRILRADEKIVCLTAMRRTPCHWIVYLKRRKARTFPSAWTYILCTVNPWGSIWAHVRFGSRRIQDTMHHTSRANDGVRDGKARTRGVNPGDDMFTQILCCCCGRWGSSDYGEGLLVSGDWSGI